MLLNEGLCIPAPCERSVAGETVGCFLREELDELAEFDELKELFDELEVELEETGVVFDPPLLILGGIISPRTFNLFLTNQFKFDISIV